MNGNCARRSPRATNVTQVSGTINTSNHDHGIEVRNEYHPRSGWSRYNQSVPMKEDSVL